MDYRPIIESRYNRENWQRLLHDIFGSKIKFWSMPSPVSTNSQFAKQALWLGTITLSDEQTISVYEVELSDSVDIERNRRGIRDMLLTAWRSNGNAGAFMFCYRKNESVLRFSYVSESWNFAEDGTYQKESTDTKRFTYLLGEGHRSRTAIQQFETLRDSALSLKDLTKAFSVDAVSDMFFKEYKKNYEDIIFYVTGKRMVKVANKWEERQEGEPCEEIMQEFAHFPNPEKAIRDYVKKLMGRLVFLQFLQKKGWLGVPANAEWGTGDAEFIQNLFANTKDKDHFIDNVLEALFNDLNSEDDKKLPQYRTPYLNGGLFERDASDETNFPLPAKYMQQMLDFFSSYNFTIDENDPDDAEVGVDPEMLGRIFENLLEDNKDKGAFYTPKEIVTYMCRESLIAYLQTDIKDEATKEAIRQFVTTHEKTSLGTNNKLHQQVDEALKEVKICDPAIGSGAFPMGLLKELFLCRTALEGISQHQAAEIKKHIIQQNIYGVDIERGAVDIARLRFWLSLIVDEETPQALPNLDFKIMQGNSLLEQYKGVDLSAMTEKKADETGMLSIFDDMLDVYRKQLRDMLNSYYNCTNHNEKKQLRSSIINNVKQQLKEQSINVEFGDLDLSGNNQFFLWHTWFYNVFSKGGFDIVIGNPPYLFLSGKGSPVKRLQKEGKTEEAAKLQSLLDTYSLTHRSVSCGCKDFYKWFYKIAIDICNVNGIQTYITPDTFISMPKYADLRQLLLQHNFCLFVDLGFSVFEAPTVSSAIGLVRKDYSETNQISYADVRAILNKSNRYNLKEIVNDTLQQVNVVDNEVCAYKNSLAFKFYTNPEMICLGDCLSFTEGEHNIQIVEEELLPTHKPTAIPVLVDSKMQRNGYVKRAFLYSNLETNKLHSGSRCILRKTGDTICVSIPETDDYAVAHQNVYVVKDKIGLSMKFWMAFLNSKMLTFLYQNGLWGQKGRTMAQFRKYALAALPVSFPFNKKTINQIESSIEKILHCNNDLGKMREENKIDNCVYHLYNLSYDEILIVDPQTPIIKEEYGKTGE